MNEMEKVLEMMEATLRSQNFLKARLEALETLITLTVAREPFAKTLISTLQIHLEEIEQDVSRVDYSHALSLLLDSLAHLLEQDRK